MYHLVFFVNTKNPCLNQSFFNQIFLVVSNCSHGSCFGLWKPSLVFGGNPPTAKPFGAHNSLTQIYPFQCHDFHSNISPSQHIHSIYITTFASSRSDNIHQHVHPKKNMLTSRNAQRKTYSSNKNYLTTTRLCFTWGEPTLHMDSYGRVLVNHGYTLVN